MVCRTDALMYNVVLVDSPNLFYNFRYFVSKECLTAPQTTFCSMGKNAWKKEHAEIRIWIKNIARAGKANEE